VNQSRRPWRGRSRIAARAGLNVSELNALISVLTERVPDALRGTATSRVTGLSYVGFLLGPVYFGWWAEWTTLAGAMLAVAGLVTTSLGLALTARYRLNWRK